MLALRSIISILAVLFLMLSGWERDVSDSLEDHSHSYHDYEQVPFRAQAILVKKFDSSLKMEYTNSPHLFSGKEVNLPTRFKSFPFYTSLSFQKLEMHSILWDFSLPPPV